MKRNPFDRLPIILYVLIINVLFAPFLDVSLSAYIFQKWFTGLMPDDIVTLLAVGYIIAIPYLVGELLYRFVNYVRLRASKEFRARVNVWGSVIFERCTFILSILLTFHTFTFGLMLGSRGLKEERSSPQQEVYQLLQAIPYEAANTLSETELCERFLSRDWQLRILKGADVLALQSAGIDHIFDTSDDVICIKHMNPEQ